MALTKSGPRLLVALSFIFYLLALTQKSFLISGPQPDAWSTGWANLLFGWFVLANGGLAWLANPLIFLSWGLFFRGWIGASCLAALFTIMLMASFLAVDLVMVSTGSNFAHVVGYGIGYWLWLSSGFSTLLGGLISVYNSIPVKSDKAVDG